MTRPGANLFAHVRPAAARPGFTLVEMAVSIAIASILFVAIGSAIVLASRAIPDAESPAFRTVRASAAVDRIAAELQTALYLMEHTPNAVAFTVADRNNDGRPERIRYAWSGQPGDPLTRQYNGGTAGAVVDHVESFNALYRAAGVTETYPGAGVEDAADSLLDDHRNTYGLGSVVVNAVSWPGQHFVPTAPGDAMAWRPTRVKFLVQKNAAPGVTAVQIRPADANLKPTTEVLFEQLMVATTLPLIYDWREFTLPNMNRLSPTTAVALVLPFVSGTLSATLRTCPSDSYLASTNQGASWTYSSALALYSQMYGRLTRPGPSQYATARYLTAVQLTVQNGSTGRPAETTVQTLNHPELLLGMWEASFGSDPTQLDVNGDSAGDWTVRGGGAFNPAWISGGVFSTSGVTLDTAPVNAFTNTTVVDLTCRSTTVGGEGALFSLNRTTGQRGGLIAILRLEADNTQTLTVSHSKSDASIEVLIKVRGLPNRLLDLRFVIDPAVRSVSITADGAHRGTFSYGTSSTYPDQCATISASGCTAEFSHVRVRILEPAP